MKNPDFFFEQYNKINWTNQDKNHLNEPVSEFVIDKIISKTEKPFSLFEIGSGIGFFIKMLINKFGKDIFISGCEPAEKSYNYFSDISDLINNIKNNQDITLIDFPQEMLDTRNDDELHDSIRLKNTEDFRYLGCLIYGPTEVVDEMSKEFKLWS